MLRQELFELVEPWCVGGLCRGRDRH
jgi:hypothetical protein